MLGSKYKTLLVQMMQILTGGREGKNFVVIVDCVGCFNQ